MLALMKHLRIVKVTYNSHIRYPVCNAAQKYMSFCNIEESGDMGRLHKCWSMLQHFKLEVTQSLPM